MYGVNILGSSSYTKWYNSYLYLLLIELYNNFSAPIMSSVCAIMYNNIIIYPLGRDDDFWQVTPMFILYTLL